MSVPEGRDLLKFFKKWMEFLIWMWDDPNVMQSLFLPQDSEIDANFKEKTCWRIQDFSTNWMHQKEFWQKQLLNKG